MLWGQSEAQQQGDALGAVGGRQGDALGSFWGMVRQCFGVRVRHSRRAMFWGRCGAQQGSALGSVWGAAERYFGVGVGTWQGDVLGSVWRTEWGQCSGSGASVRSGSVRADTPGTAPAPTMTLALVRAGARPATPEGDGGASVAARRFPHPDPQLPASCQRPQGPHGSPPPPHAAPSPLGGHGAQRTHGDISPIHLRCHPLGDAPSGDTNSLGTLLTAAQASPHCRDPVPVPAVHACRMSPSRLAPWGCATVAGPGPCVAPVFSWDRFSSQNSAAARGTVTQGCDHGPTAPPCHQVPWVKVSPCQVSPWWMSPDDVRSPPWADVPVANIPYIPHTIAHVPIMDVCAL